MLVCTDSFLKEIVFFLKGLFLLGHKNKKAGK